MLTIFLRTLSDRKVSLVIYCVASMLFVWMYIALYPSIMDQADEFNKLFEAYPKEMFQAFNIEEISFDTIEKFLALEHYSIVWPLMVMFLVSGTAGSAIAREIERGTAEILLSRPISRIKLFFSRYLAGLTVLAVFTVSSTIIAIPLAKLHDIPYVLENHVAVMLLGFLFGLAIYSIGFMFSAMFSERSKVYMVLGSMLIVMYVLQILVNFKEGLEFLQYFSFFYYFDADQAINHGIMDEISVIIFAGITALSVIVGVYWFQKRDIAV